MTLRRTSVVVVLVSVVLAVASCGSDRATAPPSGPSDGAGLYRATCASCHGADLRGTAVGPSHLSVVYEPGHHSDESFRSAIQNGTPAHHWDFGPMPAVPGLDDDQITAIIAYIRSIQEREGFEPYPPD